MMFRSQIAALHFNEKANREQARTQHGEQRYDIIYPKFKKGGYIVKKVTVNQTYGKFNIISTFAIILLNNVAGYIEDLLRETIRQCKAGGSIQPQVIPQPVCSNYARQQQYVFIKVDLFIIIE